MTADDVRELIRQACADAGSMKAWAAANDVSPQYVGDVLFRRREPAGKILLALNLEKTIDFHPRYPRKRRGAG
jgi:hypothetical protein